VGLEVESAVNTASWLFTNDISSIIKDIGNIAITQVLLVILFVKELQPLVGKKIAAEIVQHEGCHS
jgi:hypothetical protein